MSTRIEKLFWISGLCGLLYLFFAYLQAGACQASATRLINHAPSASTSAPSVMGRIEIPDLHLSAPILPNYDSDSLRKGIGHIPNTALPGGLGTVGLAGHRDTFFRPLRTLRSHTEIRLIVPQGTYLYLVDSTEIVAPNRVDVLATGAVPGLTLITCYPFNFIGAAPLRFIVHAHLLSASPASSSASYIGEAPDEVLPN
jgi:sortase A